MGGPMYRAILHQSSSVEFVRRYFAGELNRDEFQRCVSEQSDELAGSGLSAWQIDLLRRMPPDDRHAVSQLAEALSAQGFGAPWIEPSPSFTAFRDLVHTEFGHLQDRYTSIFPEEGRVAYELSMSVRPERVVVAGSYYAYLAIWLVPGLAEGGTMCCIDPDPEVCHLAEKNARHLGYADRIEVICDDAIEVLGAQEDGIDILVIDAYGSTASPDTERHGKSIYAPILRAGRPKLIENGIILAHNADRESRALDSFRRELASARLSVSLDTTEHLAVFFL